MEQLARVFDMSLASGDASELAELASLGGDYVAVRAYLGWLLGRNLFRESQREVERQLQEFVAETTSPAAAEIIRDLQGWQVAIPLLQHRFEIATKGKSNQPRRQVAALQAFLQQPGISQAELAARVDSTEGQLKRNVWVTLARKLWQETHTERR